MSDNINNGFPVPEEPITREEQYLSAIAQVTPATQIPDEPLTRIEAYLDKIVENGGGGGGGFTPTQAQLDAMNSGITAERLETDETNILSKVDKSEIYSQTFINTNIAALENVVKETGYYGAVPSTTDARLMKLATFDSYYIYADRECYIYPTAYSGLCSIVHAQNPSAPVVRQDGNINFTCKNPVRYRSTDSNLPTQANPLHVKTGDLLIFSADSGKTFNIYGYNQKTVIDSDFAELISDGIPTAKSCKIEYIYGSGVDISTERLNIYIPAAVGYVRYRFVHSVSQERNSDIWRIADAYAVDDGLAERYALTASGEWECAIHLPDRDDFSGGIAHGDEIYSSVLFLLDGVLITPNNITDVKNFGELKIVEKSALYDPDDHTTTIAIHTSEHIFEKSGVTINQRIIWEYVGALSNCYLAMFPVTKGVSSDFYTDADYTPTAIGNQSHTVTDAYNAVIYKSDVGVSSEFKIDEYPDLLSFFITDNGGTTYNKCYYVINTSTVQANTIWKSTTKYNFKVGI